jgi:hypothetical protein
MAAVRADGVGRRRGVALGAGLQLAGGEPVVRATLAGAGIGVFAFGDGHDLWLQQDGCYWLMANPKAYRGRLGNAMVGNWAE